MARNSVHDPYVAELFARHPETCKPWVSATPSSHIWTAPLPRGLGPGVHRIRVRSLDEHGRIATGHLLLEVTA